MKKTIIKDGIIINRGLSQGGDLLIEDGRIVKMGGIIDGNFDEIVATGCWVMPGVIDDQVHFREPGMTYKANIESEARAAVAGGTTTFMEMPNTKPPALTQDLLQQKYNIAAQTSLANYSFFMGVSNENFEDVMQTDPLTVCGIKIFMGSSTGNMLVDDREVLEKLFAHAPMLIATHCEDEATIERNLKRAIDKYGDDIPFTDHPVIRDAEGCYLSSSFAIDLAKRSGARLHILHISTAIETDLFRNDLPLEKKQITSEVCVHHLSLNDSYYTTHGAQIKCNPAIKSAEDQEALWTALLDNRLDIIATDHAPHTWEEKQNTYLSAPSGLPLVQHSLLLMMDHVQQGRLSKECMVEKMSHAPAVCFQIKDRGFLDEGAWADIVIANPDQHTEVTRDQVLHKCGWSPFEGRKLHGKVQSTFVSGQLIYHQDKFVNDTKGMRIEFDR